MEQSPMEKALSTDLLVDIVMTHLKVTDLLNCRQVSKVWNKSASSLLRRRSTMVTKISSETILLKLEECMEQSSDFPFAGLQFTEPWKMKTAGAMRFFHNYGDRFTRLHLNTCLTFSLQDLAPFTKHLSRLSTLELADHRCTRFQVLDPAAGQEDREVVKLSSVQTIRIMSAYNQVNEDVLLQVVSVASPSLRIECLDATHEILKGLERAGKLHVVSVIILQKHSHEISHALRLDELLWTQTPVLTRLDFQHGGCISRDARMRLLISSQHTLKELSLAGIYPFELSSECPVLPKLTTLSLRICCQSNEYIFQGSQGHKFPALKHLKLGVTYDNYNSSSANLPDGFFIVPSLTTIHLIDYVDQVGIENLARSFPNVIEIRLLYETYDFGWSECSNPTDIWSVGAFTCLEKLVIWDYIVQSPNNCYNFGRKAFVNKRNSKMMNMDSFLTGMPIGICDNFRGRPQQNLMGSGFNQILRESPSLLQLKNLKQLTVCVRLEDELKELPEEPPFISMVAVWYALEMMPNLEAKFVYEDRWVKRFIQEEDRDKAVTILKSAFKHVQPHLELEPYFY